MNPILIVGAFVMVFLAGAVVADVIVGEEQGVPLEMMGTQYNYNFLLNESGSCDLHWLRPRLYYEMGSYPDQITLVYPEITIGFFKPLDRAKEKQLLDLMNNDSMAQEMCNYPTGVTYEITTRIHPEEFDNSLSVAAAKKPIYYVDDHGNLTLLFIEPVNEAQLGAINDSLKNMWEITQK